MQTAYPYGTVSGTFQYREDADSFYKVLQQRGYTFEDVNIAMTQDTRNRYYSESEVVTTESSGTKSAEGAAAGSAVGGVVGAIAGAIIAAGASIALPGIGLIVAGPIAGALAGGGVGGAAGGIIGGLVGLGVSEDWAEVYEKDIKEGKVVITVNPKNFEDAQFIEEKMRAHQAENVYYAATSR